MKPLLTILCAALLCGCVTMPPPKWNPASDATEAEYAPYLTNGTATLLGQAFLVQRGGEVIKAAGRNVTLDPTTTVGIEWWQKAGSYWALRSFTPPSPNFLKARQTTVADAEGRFKFTALPAGKYFVRTEVTWEVPTRYVISTEGGLVGFIAEIKEGETKEIVVNSFPQAYLPEDRTAPPTPVLAPKGQ